MDSPARSWREFPQRYRLEAAKCTSCNKVLYPPRVVCPDCKGAAFETIVLPRDGKVVTFTVVRVPPAGFTEQTPLVPGANRHGIRPLSGVIKLLQTD